MIALSLPLDSNAMLNAPTDEKAAILKAWQVAIANTSSQKERDAAARFVGKLLLPHVLPVGN